MKTVWVLAKDAQQKAVTYKKKETVIENDYQNK